MPTLQDLPTRCPLCTGPVTVEKVRCGTCGSAIEGTFSLEWLGALSKEQLQFVKVFVGCRGKIKDVEEVLGLSYPTVVARLDDVVAQLESDRAANASRTERPSAAAPSPQSRKEAAATAARRLEILSALSDGEIELDEAEQKLSELSKR